MTITMSTSASPPMLELPVMSDKSFMHTEKQKPESNGTGSAHGPLSEKPLPSTVPTTITKPSAGPSSPPSPTAASAYPQPHACPSKPSLPAPASNRLLTTHLLAHPDHTAKKAIHTQFPNPNPIIRLARRFKVKHSVIKGMTDHEWKRYEKMAPELKRKAGWKRAGAPAEEEGVEVSELFWKVSSAVLLSVLEADRLDVPLAHAHGGAGSAIRSRPARPPRKHDHYALDSDLPHSRHHAALPRRHHPGEGRGLPRDQLLAVSLHGLSVFTSSAA